MPEKDYNKNKQINIRVSESEKEIINKSGYTPSKILKIFIDKYTSTTPVGLVIKLDLLKKEKEELIDKQIAIDNKINDIEQRLKNFNQLDLLPDTTITLFKTAIINYLNKSVEHMNISDFLDENKELVNIQSNKSGYEVKEYKKLVIEYYNKNYD
jgi:hypothetical protein